MIWRLCGILPFSHCTCSSSCCDWCAVNIFMCQRKPQLLHTDVLRCKQLFSHSPIDCDIGWIPLNFQRWFAHISPHRIHQHRNLQQQGSHEDLVYSSNPMTRQQAPTHGLHVHLTMVSQDDEFGNSFWKVLMVGLLLLYADSEWEMSSVAQSLWQ